MKHALIVGTGSIAKRHLKNLRTLYPDAKVFCFSPSGRKVKRSELEGSEVVKSLESALSFNLDIAIIATPSTHHLFYAEILTRHRIPILIEKPLCADLCELDDFKDLSVQRKIGVAYNFRFSPAAQFVKNYISHGKLGRVDTVFCEVGQYLPDWRPAVDYRHGVSAQKKFGGGALLELSHEIDYLNWFFGSLKRVSAVSRKVSDLEIDVEDNVDAVLESKDGAIIHLHLDFLQRPASRSLKVISEYGCLNWNLLRNQIKFTNPDGTVETLFDDYEYDTNEMYIEQLKAFISFAKGNSFFESGFENGVNVMRVVAAIRKASLSESWVSL